MFRSDPEGLQAFEIAPGAHRAAREALFARLVPAIDRAFGKTQIRSIAHERQNARDAMRVIRSAQRIEQTLERLDVFLRSSFGVERGKEFRRIAQLLERDA